MTRSWDAAAALAAADEWVWVPDAAPVVRTDEYIVVECPEWFEYPASAQEFGSHGMPSSSSTRSVTWRGAWVARGLGGTDIARKGSQ